MQRKTQWSEDSSLYKTVFETSVKMSTYLVCFIVCDFKYLTKNTKHGIQVHVVLKLRLLVTSVIYMHIFN